MGASLYPYICLPHKHRFYAPQTIDAAYGEFVMRSRSRNYAFYLSVFADPVIDEVLMIVKAFEESSDSDPWRAAALFQRSLTIVYDPAPDGSLLEIGLPPCCPYCGTDRTTQIDDGTPAVRIDLSAPTSVLWSTLSEEEKVRRIRKFLLERNSDPIH